MLGYAKHLPNLQNYKTFLVVKCDMPPALSSAYRTANPPEYRTTNNLENMRLFRVFALVQDSRLLWFVLKSDDKHR
jgi:hypothetical protein